jgi:hypothetical protein
MKNTQESKTPKPKRRLNAQRRAREYTNRKNTTREEHDQGHDEESGGDWMVGLID